MPSVPVKYSIAFKNISETGSSTNIKIIILDKIRTCPLITTNVKVPISELDIF
jgi:ribosomal protein S28E/S33